MLENAEVLLVQNQKQMEAPRPCKKETTGWQTAMVPPVTSSPVTAPLGIVYPHSGLHRLTIISV